MIYLKRWFRLVLYTLEEAMQKEQASAVTAEKTQRIVSMLSVLGGSEKDLTAHNGNILWRRADYNDAENTSVGLMMVGILQGGSRINGSSLSLKVCDINEQKLEHHIGDRFKKYPQEGIDRALTVLGTDGTLSMLLQEPQRSVLQGIFAEARASGKKDGELRRAPAELATAIEESRLKDRIGKNATLRLVAKASTPTPEESRLKDRIGKNVTLRLVAKASTPTP
jgi:hypothetical protein